MTANQRHIREIIRRLRAEGYEQVAVTHNTHHPKITWLAAGAHYWAFVAGSPRDADNCVDNFVKQARRLVARGRQ